MHKPNEDPHDSDLPADVLVVDTDSGTVDVYYPAPDDNQWSVDYTSGAFDDVTD